MIVPMKKVTVICLDKDRNAALHGLRDLGALHLVALKEPVGHDVVSVKNRLQHVRHALDVLKPHADGADAQKAPAGARFDPRAVADIVDEAHRLSARKKELGDSLDSLKQEMARVEPWGDFDPQTVARLKEAGISVKFYQAAAREPVGPAPEGAQLRILRQDKGGAWFVLIKHGEINFAGHEVPIPGRSLGEVKRLLEEQGRELDAVNSRFKELGKSGPLVAELVSRIDDTRHYVEVRRGMESAGTLAYLRGFCPVDLVGVLQAEAVKAGWGLVIDDPASDDVVPSLIKSPAWVRPIDSLLKFLKILPGYREADVSGVFLIFLSLFFAMIIGDGGYGVLFLGLTLYARSKMKNAPREPFILMGLFSVCTIIWGALTGIWFGMSPCPAPLQRFHFEWLDSNEHIMDLCLVIGATQLTIAHLWAAVRVFPSTRAIAQLGWAGMIWVIFFLARCLFRGSPFPPWIGPAVLVCVGLIFVFMTPLKVFKKEMVNNFMLPLSIMSAFGDVLSYLRLFALGVASVQLASSFNAMAMKIGFNSVLGGLGAALIIFVGHALNCVLSAMSVLVHGIRLNALEFSMHLGMEWSGVPYLPFKRRQTGAGS